ncbi:glycine betaine ABC transporter substrate-binding protein [Pontivivens insulae]|uniref:glycine betaine ABC transporter substrate-binding protein n=1 Tax=Pontivivens insulae TaxID=1639689 RepID=UPI0013C2E22F|nr:glycine betaine ABC transporter substrate-binding protein [Pontivivens insulae]
MAIALLVAVSATPPAFTQEQTVRIGQPNWFAGELVSLMLERIINERLGLSVERVPGTNAEIFDGILSETPTLDLHADTWMPNQAFWVQPGLDSGALALSGTSYPGIDGICVPQYVETQLGVDSVSQLTDPEVAALFDLDDDGRGEIWLGAEGWASTRVMQVKMEGYDLSRQLDPVLLSEEDWQTVLLNRIAAQEPVLFYCYQPHMWFALDYITVLDEPPHDPALWQLVSPEESATWIEDSNIRSADVIKDVQVSYATRLRESHPDVARLLSRFGLSGEEMTEMIFLAQVKDIGLEYVVDDWISANQSLIDQWIADE